jgi:hypothetical protein
MGYWSDDEPCDDPLCACIGGSDDMEGLEVKQKWLCTILLS